MLAIRQVHTSFREENLKPFPNRKRNETRSEVFSIPHELHSGLAELRVFEKRIREVS